MLKTKCIYLPPLATDGIRISIMSRHTLDDGKTLDPRIGSSAYQFHWPQLGPPPKLIGSYLRQEIDWSEYQGQFLSYLDQKAPQFLLHEIANLAKIVDVTLLCMEDPNELDSFGKLRCHRRLVAEACQRIDPTLIVEIR